MISPNNDFLPNSQAVSYYGGINNRISIDTEIITTNKNNTVIERYGGVDINSISSINSIFPGIGNNNIAIPAYGGVTTSTFPTIPSDYDKPISKYTGELNISKDSSIEKENLHLKIKMNGSFWGGSSVSSTEHLSRIEKEYLANERAMLINDMNDLKGKVNTKNLAKVSSTLSDAAQAGLTRKDVRTFGNLSDELQKVVDNAKTFNNYSFKEGDKKDLEDKLSANATLSYLKSDSGKAICQELGINIDNLDNIEHDKDGNIVIDGKTIQLSKDKLSVTEKSDKNNTYETSTYTLDDKYKPTETETIELETYEKYHTDSNFTNLHEKDPKTGKNLHLPENVQISDRAMQGLVNENKDISEKLENITGKKIDELKFLDNHAYYTDEKGIEHQFYYDVKNGNFINTNVTPNKEKGGYDVEVNLPKTTNTDTSKKLTDKDKQKLDEILKNWDDEKINKAFQSASEEDKKKFLKLCKNEEDYINAGGRLSYSIPNSYNVLRDLQVGMFSSLKQAIENEEIMAPQRDSISSQEPSKATIAYEFTREGRIKEIENILAKAKENAERGGYVYESDPFLEAELNRLRNTIPEH